jgi:glycosyltransferase involved in cell wall biosynthesis
MHMPLRTSEGSGGSHNEWYRNCGEIMGFSDNHRQFEILFPAARALYRTFSGAFWGANGCAISRSNGNGPKGAGDVLTIPPEASSVAILLATYHPDATVLEQVESFQTQSYDNLSLIVSDDSDGGTSELLHGAIASFTRGPTSLVSGPKRGFAQNFLSLIRRAGPDVSYACLSDQDDVWMPEKVKRSVEQLAQLPVQTPAIYCSRTLECSSDLTPIKPSRNHKRALGFSHALVQNVVAGNTIMMNRAALDILQAASAEVGEIVAHDWWVYQIITGVGGTVIMDPQPTLYYRQHDGNIIGANTGFRATWTRMCMVANGRFCIWNDINIAALRQSSHRFTPENQRRLALFARARRRKGRARLNDLRRVGVYRQSRLSNAAMWGAAAIGKI